MVHGAAVINYTLIFISYKFHVIILPVAFF